MPFELTREYVEQLKESIYNEDTAGGLMAKELVKVNENWSMNKCMQEIRRQAAEINELYYVYVVDNEGILKGALSLKRLLVSRSNAKIKNISNEEVISVHTDTSSEEVANIMDKYDLVSLPVVDTIGRLLGRILGAQVISIIEESLGIDPKIALFFPLIAAMGLLIYLGIGRLFYNLF
jgi:magnesium transporter